MKQQKILSTLCFGNKSRLWKLFAELSSCDSRRRRVKLISTSNFRSPHEWQQAFNLSNPSNATFVFSSIVFDAQSTNNLKRGF